jgi:hypothetical protein
MLRTQQPKAPRPSTQWDLNVKPLKDPGDPNLDLAVAWAEKQWGPIEHGYRKVFIKLMNPPNAFYIITHKLTIKLGGANSISQLLESNPIGMFALRSWKKSEVGTEEKNWLDERVESFIASESDDDKGNQTTSRTESSRVSDEELISISNNLRTSPDFSARLNFFGHRASISASESSQTIPMDHSLLNSNLHAIEELDYVFLTEEARGVGLSKPILEIAKAKAREAGANILVLQTLNPMVNARYKGAEVICESRDREDRNAPTEFLSIKLRR